MRRFIYVTFVLMFLHSAHATTSDTQVLYHCPGGIVTQDVESLEDFPGAYYYFDITRGTELYRLSQSGARTVSSDAQSLLRFAQVSPDGRLISTLDNNGFTIHDIVTGETNYTELPTFRDPYNQYFYGYTNTTYHDLIRMIQWVGDRELVSNVSDPNNPAILVSYQVQTDPLTVELTEELSKDQRSPHDSGTLTLITLSLSGNQYTTISQGHNLLQSTLEMYTTEGDISRFSYNDRTVALLDTVWSPNEEMLAFTTRRPDLTSAVEDVVILDTETQEVIFDTNQLREEIKTLLSLSSYSIDIEYNLKWSLDSSRIGFIISSYRNDIRRLSQYSYVLDLPTDTVEINCLPITSAVGPELERTTTFFSPDGRFFGIRNLQQAIAVEYGTGRIFELPALNNSAFNTFPGWVEQPAPIADAGDDQTLVPDDNNHAEVTLDGSGSYDDYWGSIVSYQWTDASGEELATGVNPTISLPTGEHRITLTVTDNDGVSSTDEVVITIEASVTMLSVVDYSATPGDGDSNRPALSYDGRYVVFMSLAKNLDTEFDLEVWSRGLHYNIYQYDREDHNSTLVSVQPRNYQVYTYARAPSISDDGEIVAYSQFVIQAVNVPGIIQWRDLQVGGTPVTLPDRKVIAYSVLDTLALSSGGSHIVFFDENRQLSVYSLSLNSYVDIPISSLVIQDQDSHEILGASISSDGQIIAFVYKRNFDDEEGTRLYSTTSVYTYHVGTQTLTEVSQNASELLGLPTEPDFANPMISADGRYVTFWCNHNDGSNLVLYSVDDQTLELITRSLDGAPVSSSNTAWDSSPSISADGRYVAYVSFADNLTPNDNNEEADLFVFDRILGINTRVPIGTTDGQPRNAPDERFDISSPAISGNGRFVAFESQASNLVIDDNNNASDIFLVEVQFPNVAPQAEAGNNQIIISPDGNPISVSLNASMSVDLDGQIVSYRWVYRENEIGNASEISFDFPLGTHTISLEVTDDGDLVSTDTVQIDVINAPVADAGEDQLLHDLDMDGVETVDLDAGSSSYNLPADFRWYLDDVEVGQDITTSVELSVGTHQIRLELTEDTADGTYTSSDTVQILINEPPIADAGNDIVVSDTDEDFVEIVELNATQSIDADGQIVSYRWIESDIEISTEAVDAFGIPIR